MYNKLGVSLVSSKLLKCIDKIRMDFATYMLSKVLARQIWDVCYDLCPEADILS